MTTLDEAVQQVREGADPATVLADLQSTPLHKRDTWVTSDSDNQLDLLEMLVETKMLRLDPATAAWVGPLVDFTTALPDGNELKEGFGILLAYLQLANRPLPVATKLEIAVLLNGMIDAMLALGVTQEVIDGYVAKMTGGRLHADVTVETLTRLAAEQKSESLQAYHTTLWNTYVAPVLQSNDPDAITDVAMKTAILAIYDNWVDQV